MDEQADAVENFTPEQIGRAFLSQFYDILHQNTEVVHRFYQDTSTMSRPAMDGSVITVTTMKGINDFMLSLDYKHYKTEIMTTDAQSSYDDGVLVLVTGCLTGEDNTRRKFTETFFLAPQTNGYYVLNDAFRFVEEDSLPAVTSVQVESSGEIAATCTLADEAELAEFPDESLPDHVDAIELVPNGDTDVHDKSGEKLTVEEEPAVTEPPLELVTHVDDQVAVESSAVIGGISKKKSYASIVKDREKGVHTTPVHIPSTNTKTKATNSGHQARGTMPSLPKPQANETALSAGQQLRAAANPTALHESSVPNGNSRPEIDIVKAEDKGYSVHIGKLPYDATVNQVEQVFTKFGPIKQGGVQVIQTENYCFGFVEFESLRSAQKAIQASPISIGWHKSFVEEKRSAKRANSGVSTPSPGRGGYRGNDFQGQGSISSWRGNSRNDYERRGNYGNVTRNGDGYNRGY